MNAADILQIYTAIVDAVNARLATLDQILLDRTWLVGERITLADVFVCTALTNAFSGPIDASMRAKLPNVTRYLNT
jgi:elongation factor 1-gamma